MSTSQVRKDKDGTRKPQRSKHKSKHCQADKHQTLIPSYARSASKVSKNRITQKVGLYVLGKTSTSVSRGNSCTEEHKARADENLSKILDLASLDSRKIPTLDEIMDSQESNGQLPVLPQESPKSPDAIFPMLSPAKESPVFISHRKSSGDALKRKLHKVVHRPRRRLILSQETESSFKENVASLLSSPDSPDKPLSMLDAAKDLYDTIKIKLKKDMVADQTDYLTEIRQKLQRIYRQSCKANTILNTATTSTTSSETTRPESANPCPVAYSSPKCHSLITVDACNNNAVQRKNSKNFDDIGTKFQSGDCAFNSSNTEVPTCSQRVQMNFAPGSASHFSAFHMPTNQPLPYQQPLEFLGICHCQQDGSSQSVSSSRSGSKRHILLVNPSSSTSNSQQMGSQLLDTDCEFPHIHWPLNDDIFISQGPSEMDILDYADMDVTVSSSIPTSTNPRLRLATPDSNGSPTWRPLPTVSPITIPPFKSPSPQFYRHKLY